MSYDAPFAGLKVVDLSQGIAGPYCAMLLAQHNEVVALDIVQAKVDLLNQKKSPIHDAEIEDFLANKPLNFKATTNKEEAYVGASFVIIATPTAVGMLTHSG